MIVISVKLRVLFMYWNVFGSFQDCWEYTYRKRDIVDIRKMRRNFIPKQSENLCFGPTALFAFKVEMMLGFSFLLVGNKKNDLEELFSMYSKNYSYE